MRGREQVLGMGRVGCRRRPDPRCRCVGWGSAEAGDGVRVLRMGRYGKERSGFVRGKAGSFVLVCTGVAGVFARLCSCGGMRQSILFKTVVILGGIAAFGGAVFLEVTHGTEVRGDAYF
jgi:hypothetical protein